MNFEQPSAVPTDAQIEATLTALRVQITDKQAEIARQDAVINSNRYTIQQTANEKAELIASISDLQSKKEKLENIIAELESNKNVLETTLSITRETIATWTAQMTAGNEQIQKEKAELELKAEALKQEREVFDTYKADVEQKEIDLDGIKSQLKAIIN